MKDDEINNQEITLLKSNPDILNLKKKLLSKKYLIVLCGPTGIGKSKSALILAKILDTDLISADSMQSYVGMDIGTDKQDFRKYGVNQFLIDICSPDHILTSVEYRDMARVIIKTEFFDKERIPILTGGSGLHIRAIVDDLMEAPEGSHALRKKIKDDIAEKGLQYYFEKLKQIDFEYASKIKPNDERRIIRAIEVYKISGKKYSSFQNKWEERKSVYNCVFIGLAMEREKLYEKIEKRIDQMLDAGLVDEVRELVKSGYKDCFSLQQAIGYKEILRYLASKSTLEDAVSEIKKNTRHLVKKQLTWFKADPRINWLTTDNYDSIYNLIKDILSIISRQVSDEKN